jgi:hypothetical protein
MERQESFRRIIAFGKLYHLLSNGSDRRYTSDRAPKLLGCLIAGHAILNRRHDTLPKIPRPTTRSLSYSTLPFSVRDSAPNLDTNPQVAIAPKKRYRL